MQGRQFPEGTGSHPPRCTGAQVERAHGTERCDHIPLLPRLRLTEDSHPVEPSGLAHLVARYALKLG